MEKKKIIIGTANFGSKYGFQKRSVSKDEVKKIFSFLKKNKISFIETSENYKEAIKMLSLVNLNNFQIILKISLKNEETKSFLNRINKLYKQLKIKKKIYAILIHNFPNNLKKEKIKSMLNELNSFKFAKKKGISIYSISDLKKIKKISWRPDIIQVPANILDKRFVDENKINHLLKNTEIHIRSIFLQGLLLNLNFLPTYFNRWKKIFEKLKSYCIEKNIDLLGLNMNYVSKIKSDKIIIGINSLNQIKEVLSYKKKNINLNFDLHDLKLLDPRKWKI